MTTDLIMTKVSRKEANRIADLAENNTAQYFVDHYKLLWPMKYASFAICAFVRARIREFSDGWHVPYDKMKKEITVDYIRSMFEYNEFPKELWLGDATVEILINTYLLAFLHDGKHVDYDDDTDEEMEEMDGYKAISGDYCKFHSNYKGYEIYRAWNIPENHGKMRYFAVRDGEVIEARNLSGIKAKC